MNQSNLINLLNKYPELRNEINMRALMTAVRSQEEVLVISCDGLWLIVTPAIIISTCKEVYQTLRARLKLTEENRWYKLGHHGYYLSDKETTDVLGYYKRITGSPQNDLDFTDLWWGNAGVFLARKNMQYVFVAEKFLNVIPFAEQYACVVGPSGMVTAVVVEGVHIIAPVKPDEVNIYLKEWA